MVFNQSQFLDFVLGSIEKYRCGSWSIKGKNRINLMTEGSCNEFVLIEWPDGENTSDSKIGIDNRRSIQRIICDDISIGRQRFFCIFFMKDLIKLGTLLTGKSDNRGVKAEMFLNNQITMNILMKLLISELVLGFELDHWRMFQNGGNFLDGIEN